MRTLIKKKARLLTFGVLATFFSSPGQIYLISFFIPPMREALHLSQTEISGLFFIGTIVVLEAWPVHLILMSRFTAKPLSQLHLLEIAASFLMVALLSAAAFVLPMKIGIRQLQQREQF